MDRTDSVFTAGDGFTHYRQGTGIAIRINFDQVDTSEVAPSDFEEVQRILKDGTPGEYPVDDRTKFNTGDKLLGNITLRLQGTATISEEGEYSFSGTLKSFDDVYDFNPSDHRGLIAETLTRIGNKVEGEPYDIQIRGAKDICEGNESN